MKFSPRSLNFKPICSAALAVVLSVFVGAINPSWVQAFPGLSFSMANPSLQVLLGETTGERVYTQNSVELLVDGPEFYPRRLKLIQQANRTIDLITYLWCDDEAGIRIAQELAAAIRRGVRVRATVEFLNFAKKHDQVYEILERAGSPVLVYNPPYWGLTELNNHSAHEKIMIVDGEVALVGGANLCEEYMIGGPRGLWRDFEVEVRGPVIERIQSRYDTFWNRNARVDLEARVRN